MVRLEGTRRNTGRSGKALRESDGKEPGQWQQWWESRQLEEWGQMWEEKWQADGAREEQKRAEVWWLTPRPLCAPVGLPVRARSAGLGSGQGQVCSEYHLSGHHHHPRHLQPDCSSPHDGRSVRGDEVRDPNTVPGEPVRKCHMAIPLFKARPIEEPSPNDTDRNILCESKW